MCPGQDSAQSAEPSFRISRSLAKRTEPLALAETAAFWQLQAAAQGYGLDGQSAGGSTSRATGM